MSDNKVEVIYKKSELEKFRMDILTLRRTELFLPVSFIEEGDMIGGVYDTRDYVSMNDPGDLSESLVIGSAASLLSGISKAEKMLFFAGEYSLSPENVYVCRKYPKVALIYNKKKPDPKSAILCDIARILKCLAKWGRAEGKYENMALVELGNRHLSLEEIALKLSKIEKEAYRSEH